jgi:hypothetical protein
VDSGLRPTQVGEVGAAAYIELPILTRSRFGAFRRRKKPRRRVGSGGYGHCQERSSRGDHSSLERSGWIFRPQLCRQRPVGVLSVDTGLTARRSRILDVAPDRIAGACSLGSRQQAMVGVVVGGRGATAVDRLRPSNRSTRIHPRLRCLRCSSDPQFSTRAANSALPGVQYPARAEEGCSRAGVARPTAGNCGTSRCLAAPRRCRPKPATLFVPGRGSNRSLLRATPHGTQRRPS